MTPEHELFETDRRLEGILLGRLRGGEAYLIRFPYTQYGIKKIRRGLLIGIENFHSDENATRYSILQIVRVEPIDYALGSSADRLIDEYPGFVEEAARSTVPLWEQQMPEEETTRIQVEVVPIGVMIEHKEDAIKLTDDTSLPKLGATARLLTSEMMSKIVNQEVPERKSIVLGTLLEDEKVPFKINASELCKTHLGIFGFTRTGKSNLASNIVAAILRAAKERDECAKVIVIDYTNEYFPLLADCFKEIDEAFLLVLDPERLPREFANVYNDEEAAQRVAHSILSNMVIPDELSGESQRSALFNVLKEVIMRCGVKVCTLTALNVEAARRLWNILYSYDPGHLGKARDALYSWPEALEAQESLNVNNLETLASKLEGDARGRRATFLRREVERPQRPQGLLAYTRDNSSHISTQVEMLYGEEVTSVSPTAVFCMRKMAKELRSLSNEREFIESLPDDLKLGKETFIEMLNDNEKLGLFIATSDRTDDLCMFLHDIVEELYNERRRRGIKRPLALFMVDEADEFVPPKAEAAGARESSRMAAELLARRSGKLGMGIGLATQRVAYLETRVIGNLHTYFVSKLPRKSDRERVAEAFGIPVEVVDRTLELKRGEWMVISHSAAGIPVTPFLVRFPKAEERVLTALKLETI